jgi:hypothetical protein
LGVIRDGVGEGRRKDLATRVGFYNLAFRGQFDDVAATKSGSPNGAVARLDRIAVAAFEQ